MKDILCNQCRHTINWHGSGGCHDDDNNVPCKCKWSPQDIATTLIGKTENVELIKAEQQLTGFDHLYQGGDILSLVESMGLRYEEWEQLKPTMLFLAKCIIDDIDECFQNKKRRTATNREALTNEL